jgi:riboflavin-specific deaminase-like protein
MQQWYPGRRDEPDDAVYADLPPDGPWVGVNMVTSVDGAITVDGVSGPLGGDGDLAAFRALRAAPDVILVGAGTVRAEGYGPPRTPEAAQQARRARGQAARPTLAVVSGSLDLTGAERLLDADAEVLVLTPRPADAARAAALRDRGVEVVEVDPDDGRFGAAAAIRALAGRGLTRVLCEGGPHLNRDLLAAGLVDELFVTLAPTLVGSDGPGLLAGTLPAPATLHLVEGRRHGHELLLRYRVQAHR